MISISRHLPENATWLAYRVEASKWAFIMTKSPASFDTTDCLRVERQSLEKVGQIVGVLFFLLEDLLHQSAGGRVFALEVPYDRAVSVDGDALGDQIFGQHTAQRVRDHIVGVAARGEALGREIGLATELGDALGDTVGVRLLFLRVLHQLSSDRMAGDAADCRAHVVVIAVPQHAHQFGRQRVVEQLDDGLAVALIILSDRALFDVLSRALFDRLEIE